MTILPRALRQAATLAACFLAGLTHAAEPHIPEALKPWEGWVLWQQDDRACPPSYADANKRTCFWPSRLSLDVGANGGTFSLEVAVYAESWVPLPGGIENWPQSVKANDTAVPVLEREGRPMVKLAPGVIRLQGSFPWNSVPQTIAVPKEIGILSLTLNGQQVESPAWDTSGALWLKRDAVGEEETKNFLSVKVFNLLQDGIPLWWRSQIELIVSGKSREEDIGNVLPEGWKLAELKSPIPVAIDANGRMKAQVRAGRWTIEIAAFRLDNALVFRFPSGAKPAVPEEFIAFQSNPELRMVDIIGAPSVDVSQTTFPQQWASFPVYRWDTAGEFRIEERMRGMGLQKAEGITVKRQWWLDEDGKGLTFRDEIRGQMQQIWRLDAALGQDLGSVRSSGAGQLITRNPQTGAPGVEIRTRDIDLEATGRVNQLSQLSAAGWQADANDVKVTLNLPPGWRLFAIFGPDYVSGDWVTAWTLLDLFLLLIFTFAVFRMKGFLPAVVAFLAFTLSYHEAGAPRYVWLALLVPLALIKVVPTGIVRNVIVVWKWCTLMALVFVLVPFISDQVQQTLYPQMEVVRNNPGTMYEASQSRIVNAPPAESSYIFSSSSRGGKWKSESAENLAYDTKARIQTGPGIPQWTWRIVTFGWDGPVANGQQVQPVFIPVWLEQILSVVRVVLLLGLAAVLLDARDWGRRLFRHAGKVAMGMALLCATGSVKAQFPEQFLLDQLRERLTKVPDAFPNAASIPSVNLSLEGRKLLMEVEVHTAASCAVPLPGRLPAWSPVSVLVNGRPESALRRDDGYLWVVLPQGVHRVQVQGLLSDATEWEWTFLLKPHRVTVQAPDWAFSGVKADGSPEQQVFFALKQKANVGQSSYELQNLQSIAEVERNIELGLVWQVHTKVKRLSPDGKAISLRIPLLPGENVLTANALVVDGCVEVRLGAQQSEFSWDSELSSATSLKLLTAAGNSWVERWRLVVSPVWNVEMEGLPPIFEPGDPALVPVWRPWPGEGVELQISRPEAVPGETVTVNKATHDVTIGQRQSISRLELSLLCSLGEDFLVELPAAAEVTSLKRGDQELPVRKDGSKLIIPLHPGSQDISIAWKESAALGVRSQAGAVRLPVDSANVSTSLSVPESRWILLTYGPLRGPAVQFWAILVCALLAALVLGRVKFSPLGVAAWMMLAVGLTQVPLLAALFVVGWLFLLKWRGAESCQRLDSVAFNLTQFIIVGATGISLIIFIFVVGAGLLGSPEMFIQGNGSYSTMLNWYQPQSGDVLPQPGCYSISIWWYRLLMLVWALWLAVALIRWLRWGWTQFGQGGFWRQPKKAELTPPPIKP